MPQRPPGNSLPVSRTPRPSDGLPAMRGPRRMTWSLSTVLELTSRLLGPGVPSSWQLTIIRDQVILLASRPSVSLLSPQLFVLSQPDKNGRRPVSRRELGEWFKGHGYRIQSSRDRHIHLRDRQGREVLIW